MLLSSLKSKNDTSEAHAMWTLTPMLTLLKILNFYLITFTVVFTIVVDMNLLALFVGGFLALSVSMAFILLFWHCKHYCIIIIYYSVLSIFIILVQFWDLFVQVWPLLELRQLNQVVSLDFPTYYYYHYHYSTFTPWSRTHRICLRIVMLLL